MIKVTRVLGKSLSLFGACLMIGSVTAVSLANTDAEPMSIGHTGSERLAMQTSTPASPSAFQPIHGCVDYADAFGLSDLTLGSRGFVINDTVLVENPLAIGNPFTIASVVAGEQFLVTAGPACNNYLVMWEIELSDGRKGWISDAAVKNLDAAESSGTSGYIINPGGLTARIPGSTYYAPGTYPDIGRISQQVGPLEFSKRAVNLADVAVFVIEESNNPLDFICTAVSLSELSGYPGDSRAEVACVAVDASLIVVGAAPLYAPFLLVAEVFSNPEVFIDPWLNRVNDFAWSMPLTRVFCRVAGWQDCFGTTQGNSSDGAWGSSSQGFSTSSMAASIVGFWEQYPPEITFENGESTGWAYTLK